ncbi:hypothetical protein [Nocardia sp. NPDC052112]|uniref:hypothetical protein n=1 Tax=Nocardia sp. NPDC052112 TaxID=3155646 RepID=UPI00343845A2
MNLVVFGARIDALLGDKQKVAAASLSTKAMAMVSHVLPRAVVRLLRPAAW